MHARELAVMASWIAGHSDRLALRREPTSCPAVQQYWSSCNARMQRWMRVLGNGDANHHLCELGRVRWTAAQVVVEEILMSEVLTRTWAGFVWDREKFHPDPGMRTVVLHVHAQQSEARNLALRLLVASDPRRDQAAVHINQLRVQLERWSDLCLAQLANPGVGVRFAFEPRRVMNFRPPQGRDRSLAPRGELDRLSRIFFDDLSHSTSRLAANPDWNRKVANGVMACLEVDQRDIQRWPNAACRLGSTPQGAG